MAKPRAVELDTPGRSTESKRMRATDARPGCRAPLSCGSFFADRTKGTEPFSTRPVPRRRELRPSKSRARRTGPLERKPRRSYARTAKETGLRRRRESGIEATCSGAGPLDPESAAATGRPPGRALPPARRGPSESGSRRAHRAPGIGNMRELEFVLISPLSGINNSCSENFLRTRPLLFSENGNYRS